MAMKRQKKTLTISRIICSQDGQLTILLAISLTIFITMMGFIINVGLFVKAKINLQNATDAAAWSGAAVQARQLSQISYLNYEIRNVFKEWMFKYYVLGNLAHSLRIEEQISNASEGKISFRLPTPAGLNAKTRFDRYNIPSICVHAGAGEKDICLGSFVVGLPRFETVDLPNITSENQQFLDTLASGKATDCARRTNINFATALLWTYGTGGDLKIPGLSTLTSDRLGAWPAAFFLAARIRNLEAMVNRPPEPEICSQGCQAPINSPRFELDQVANERPRKAYLALLRNYGGGRYKEAGGQMDNSVSTLKLEELSPSAVKTSPHTLSGMLIPVDADLGGYSPLNKYYLDLQILPINYAIFYTSLAPSDKNLILNGTALPTSASCQSTRTAIPVPAYIMGYQKNPQLLTYYAVRSEVKFSGLFFPSRWGTDGLTISAVAAAKPFGGRIGPRIFHTNSDITTSSVQPRGVSGGVVPKSAHYLSGVVPQANNTVFRPGSPIPTNSSFWLNANNSSNIIGGDPQKNESRFSIPNMLYYFSSPAKASAEASRFAQNSFYQDLREYTESNTNIVNEQGLGLYDQLQFKNLLKNLRDDDTIGLNNFSIEQLTQAIKRLRQPTYYDSLNYLIPSLKDVAQYNVKSNKNNFPQQLEDQMILYGPLIDPKNSIYKEAASLKNLAFNYIKSNNSSIEAFLKSLEQVAQRINTDPQKKYQAAAEYIYPLSTGISHTDSVGFKSQVDQASCNNTDGPKTISIAARFSSFLQGDEEACPQSPTLSTRLSEYITDQINSNSISALYHHDYWWTQDAKRLQKDSYEDGVSVTMSAYRPGPSNGANNAGIINNPLRAGRSHPTHRNYYSTKFIGFKLINDSSPNAPPGLHEKYTGSIGQDISMPEDAKPIDGIKNILATPIPEKVKW